MGFKIMDNEIKIEKGIPIPQNNVGRNAQYPLSEMEVGDSFFVPAKGKKESTLRQISSGGNTRYKPKKFIYRTEPPNAEVINGIRIWRIK